MRPPGLWMGTSPPDMEDSCKYVGIAWEFGVGLTTSHYKNIFGHI